MTGTRLREAAVTAVLHCPRVEQVLDGEQQIIDQLGTTSVGTQRTVTRMTGTAVGGTHAKATGLLTGKLTVANGLSPELARSMFARPGRYDTLVRFSQGPPKAVPDAAPGQRGSGPVPSGSPTTASPGNGATCDHQ